MTKLTLDTITLLSANTGQKSIFPQLKPLLSGNYINNIGENIPENETRHFGYGSHPQCLPYTVQGGYNRSLDEKQFKVAILENDLIKATFLLEYGARLWSIYDKLDSKELIYRTPVFQPGNLAIRNAWFSGGIEWNFAIPGHSPFTFSSLFAAKTKDHNHNDALRLYEFERITSLPFQIDIYLLEDSPYIYVRVTIENTSNKQVPMYWWTNAAVPEKDDTRILVSADKVFCYDYDRNIDLYDLPTLNNVDITYPSRIQKSCDYFYKTDTDCLPCQAAVDKNGIGVANISTKRLKGRKLFVWGQGQGGVNWQDFLSERGERYLEIQSGITTIQAECIPMPAGAKWSWIEAWGPITLDPIAAHSPNWQIAKTELKNKLYSQIQLNFLENQLEKTEQWVHQKPENILHYGSGWGALENERRIKTGINKAVRESLVFPKDSMTQQQRPWLNLLAKGDMDDFEITNLIPIDSWMIQDEWFDLLQKNTRNNKHNWLEYLHLGIMHYDRKESDEAQKSWEKSLELHPSMYACYCLAVLKTDMNQTDQAVRLYKKCIRMNPSQFEPVIEIGKLLLKLNRAKEFINLIEMKNFLPETVAQHPDIRLLTAQCYLQTGNLDYVENYLKSKPVIPEIRECEVNLTDLWFELKARQRAQSLGIPITEEIKNRVMLECKPPKYLDFRMT